MNYQVCIIGGGPAGIAAGIQLSRSGYSPLLIEKYRIGGLLWHANLVENYPGFPNGIRGPVLVHKMQLQLAQHGVDVVFDSIESVHYAKGRFQLTGNDNNYSCTGLLVATGTSPRIVTPPGFTDSMANKVFFEIPPLIDKQDKTIAIIGGGDAAFDYALNLAKKNSVSINYRSMQDRCLSILRERAEEHNYIQICPGYELKHLDCMDNYLAVTWNTASGSYREYVDYVLYAIGREPENDLLARMDLTAMESLTSQGLLHVIGDVKNGLYRQMSIAVGDGIRAAMQLHQTMQQMSSTT